MATIRRMWRCTNSQCKNDTGKHRGYKKVCTGEKQALCKHCGSSMELSKNHVTRIQRDGQTFTRSVSNKGDAEAYLAHCITARHSGALMPGEEKLISWKEAGRIFEEDMEDRLARGKSKGTVMYYRSSMKTLTEHFGKMYLQNIEDHHVQQFIRLRSKVAGNSIVNGNVAILKIIFKLVCKRLKARQYPRLHEAYTDIFKVERLSKGPRREIILETEEEISALLSYASKNAVLHHFIFGILNTGLRHTDMLKLREGEFDWSRGELRTTVKGGKEVWIPLTDQYQKYVKEWLKNRRVITIQRYLFPNMKKPGECLSVTSQFGWDGTCIRVAEHFEALKKPLIAAKFRALTPHHLRHTFATHYLYKTSQEYGTTVAVYKLSLILGHSSEYITKTYLHRIGEQDQAAMQSFGNQMFQSC